MGQFPTKYRQEKPESQFILCLIIEKTIQNHKQAMLEFRWEHDLPSASIKKTQTFDGILLGSEA